MLHIWNIIALIGLHIAVANDNFLNPRRYVLHVSQSTWTDARTACSESGGGLATIYDYSTIPDLNLEEEILLSSVRWFWIGLHWNNIEQAYAWGTDDEITWYNWGPGINTTQAGLCVVASSSKPYLWETVDCGRHFPYLCQHAEGQCRFVKYQNMSIASHNFMYMYRRTEEHCKRVCTDEMGSICRSFDFFPEDGRCEFNSGNRWTLEQYYGYRQGWVYLHRTCNLGEVQSNTISPSSTMSPTVGCLQASDVFVTSSFIVTSTHDVFVTRDVPVTRDVIVTRGVPVTRDFIVTSTQVYKTTLTVTETSTHVIMASPTIKFPSVSSTKDPVEELKEIGEIATKRKKTLKKISVEDKRPSAKYVGYVAIVFMSFVFGAIVLFDIISLCRYLTCCNSEKKPDSDQQNDSKIVQKQFDWRNIKYGHTNGAETEEKIANVRQRVTSTSDFTGHDEDPSTSHSSELNHRTRQMSKMVWRPIALNMGDSGIEGSDVSSSPYHSDTSSDTFHFTFNHAEQRTDDSEFDNNAEDERKIHIYQITRF